MQKDKFTVSLADLEIESLISQDNANSSALWDDPENLINIQFEDSSDGQSSPIQVTFGPQPEKIFHPQQDLFRSYISSQALYGATDHVDHDVWLRSLPHLAEAWSQKRIEYEREPGFVHYYYVGNPQEYCVWRIRWSEMFEDC
jgi:hypothetical protein